MSEAPAKQRHQVPTELFQPLSLNLWTKLLLLVPDGPRSRRSCLAGSVFAVIAASLLLLNQLLVNLGDLSKYEDAKKEFPPSVTDIVVNGKSIAVAGLLTLLAVLCLLISLAIVISSNDLGTSSIHVSIVPI